MNEKEKQVQIPFKTFVGLLALTDDLINGYDDDIDIDKVKEFYKVLNNKLDAMLKREIYTKYKTAPTEEEREKARIEYLEKIGINKDFRW